MHIQHTYNIPNAKHNTLKNSCRIYPDTEVHLLYIWMIHAIHSGCPRSKDMTIMHPMFYAWCNR